MIRLFGQFLKLPVTVFVSGMSVFLKSMQEMQRSFEIGVDDMVQAVVGESETKLLATPRSLNTDTIPPLPVEEPIMYNDGCEPNLNTDDLKSVAYWITFLKPDYEASLQERRDKTFDYRTTNFASERFAEFLDRLHSEGIEVPPEWKDLPSADYLLDPVTGRLIEIPERDRRYIDVKIHENWRLPKQSAEYEREHVDVLKQIRDRL